MAELGQLEVIAEKSIKVSPPPERDPVTGTESPRVAFPSVMVLTYEQELALVEHALKRTRELEEEMGRDGVLGDNWWDGHGGDGTSLKDAANSWMGKRARWQAMFKNDVSWRPILYPNSIFADSNEVVPISRRITRQLQARADNYFFGTEPWFATSNETTSDDDLANSIDRFATWKLGKTGSKQHKQRAMRQSFINGEAVVKTAYVVRDQIYQTTVRVLVGADGVPVKDQRGEFVLENALWVQTENPKVRVLGTDPAIVEPLAPVYVDQVITKRHVMFEGAESKPINFKDFLCSLTATDLQTADCCVHLFDRPIMEMVDLFAKRGALEATDAERYASMQRAVEAIRKMSDNSSEAKSGLGKGTLAENNGSVAGFAPAGGSMPIVEVAECYLWYDVNGDGIMENVFLVLDRKNGLPLYYNHMANETPDGMRPLDVVTPQEVDDRWYGIGTMEMFESSQMIMDLLVNRWNFSQSKAGRVDFWDPSKVEEGTNDKNLLLNWGGTYTAKPGVDPKTILHSVYLNDVKFEALQQMFQFFQQMAMNESGVMNSNDAASAGLDTGKLATGIRNIEKAGEELFAPALSSLEPGITSTLNRELDVLFANLNEAETFSYFQGESQLTKTITPEDVRGLRIRVSLYLTRYKGQQQFEQCVKVTQVIQNFYALPPDAQVRVAPFYRNMLRAIDPKIEANDIIIPLPPLPVGPDGLPVAAGGAAGGKGTPSAPKVAQIHPNTALDGSAPAG